MVTHYARTKTKILKCAMQLYNRLHSSVLIITDTEQWLLRFFTVQCRVQ